MMSLVFLPFQRFKDLLLHTRNLLGKQPYKFILYIYEISNIY